MVQYSEHEITALLIAIDILVFSNPTHKTLKYTEKGVFQGESIKAIFKKYLEKYLNIEPKPYQYKLAICPEQQMAFLFIYKSQIIAANYRNVA